MSRKLAQIGLVAAVYAVLTITLAPISYGPIQMRLSEIMTLLAFFNPVFIPGLVIGTFLANMLSPLGAIDMFFGTLATLIAVFMMNRTRNIWLASLWPVVVNGVIIGLELYYLFALPLGLTMLQVALGELIVVTFVGVPLFKRFFMGREWFERLVK